MMSEGDAQAPMWSYQVNLEKRVRDDHPLRRINQGLDLGFVGKQVAHTLRLDEATSRFHPRLSSG